MQNLDTILCQTFFCGKPHAQSSDFSNIGFCVIVHRKASSWGGLIYSRKLTDVEMCNTECQVYFYCSKLLVWLLTAQIRSCLKCSTE